MAVKTQYKQKYEMNQPPLISLVDNIIAMISKLLLKPGTSESILGKKIKENNSSEIKNYENSITYAFGYSMIY